jgi:prophage regulatory protein
MSTSNTRFLRLPDVMRATGLSKSSIYAAVKVGTFPSPVPILPGGRSSAWVEAEVNAWLAVRIGAARAGVAR